MKKHEVLKALDRIRYMTPEKMAINDAYIQKVSEAAYGLIKNGGKRK